MKKIALSILAALVLVSCSSKTDQKTAAVKTEAKPNKKQVGEALIHQIAGKFSIDQAREMMVYFAKESLKALNEKSDQEIKPEQIVAILIFTDPVKQTDFAPYPHPASCVLRNGVISFDTFKWKNINPGLRENYAHLFPWGVRPYEALESGYVENYDIAEKIAEGIDEDFPKESIDFYIGQLKAVLKWKPVTELQLNTFHTNSK